MPPREHASAKIVTLSQHLDQLFGSLGKQKPTTARNYARARRLLEEFFTRDRSLDSITEADADDYKVWLEKLAPFNPDPKVYHHNHTGEDNADAHLKRQVMGREVVVAVTDGKLDFGPWEQIFYGEFDGHRPKRVLVKVIGE